MESQAVPYFVFIWMPTKSHDTHGKNELITRTSQYTYAMELLRKDSPVQSELRIALDARQLCLSLQPITNHLPVYVLLGHGSCETGGIRLYDDSLLTPTVLLEQWTCDFPCDVIVTACGANVFCSPLHYPQLLRYSRHCRFLPAAMPDSDKSWMTQNPDGRSVHLELTELLLAYLRVYDASAQSLVQPVFAKTEEFIKRQRRTTRQRLQEQEKERVAKEVREHAEKERTKWEEWVKTQNAKLQEWRTTERQNHAFQLRLSTWRERWFCVFMIFVFFQFLDVFLNHGPLLQWATLDVLIYCVVLRK